MNANYYYLVFVVIMGFIGIVVDNPLNSLGLFPVSALIHYHLDVTWQCEGRHGD